MLILKTLFYTLLSSLLVIALLSSLAIALYLLKILLEELFDNDGVERLTKWIKNIGAIVLKKKD